MKTLFIETDSEVNWGHLETLSKLFEEDYNKFDIVITNASQRAEELIEAIQQADKIYLDSALVYNYFGDGSTLFNAMMYKAIELGIEGKEVYFFREFDGIQWDDLRKHLLDKTFRKNYLYVENTTGDKYVWEQVDIDKLLEQL